FYSPSHDFLDNVDNSKFISINNRICKNLKTILSRSGFLIIDATESTHANFRVILDDIFGQDHHVSTIIWTKVVDSVSSIVSLSHQKSPSSHFDYLLIYCKDPEHMAFNKLPPDPSTYSNPDRDPRGPWHSMPLVASQKSTNKIFSYTFKNGDKEWTLTKKWRYPFYSIQKLERENRLYFTNPKRGFGTPRVKKFLSERIIEYNKTGARGFTPNSLWADPQKFTVSETYKRLIEMTTKQKDIVFDSFSQNGQILKQIENLNRKYIGVKILDLKSSIKKIKLN
ncbi:MAG: DNA methyltransferase, partial [Promethearchaeota archaeon]